MANTIIYSTFPYVYIGFGYLIELLKIKGKLISFITKAGNVLGKYSYSLYISHYTILFVFSKLIHNVLLYVLFSIPVIVAIGYLLESWLQPAVINFFGKRNAAPTLSILDEIHFPAGKPTSA